MKISLEGRVALVTGASRGIGRAIAIALAGAGADIAVNYRREEAEANETAAAVRKLGRRAELYCASVEDDDACAAMVNAAARDFGSLSILVNNAGIASRGNSVGKRGSRTN
jgi:3-oxoacyl-[acyl-carrier protein] reductase